MGRFSRRSFILAAGCVVVAREMLQPRKAHAYFGVRDADDVKECLERKGKVTYFSEPKDEFVGYCDTAEDLECMRRLDDNKAFYDIAANECRIEGDWGGYEKDPDCFLTTACVRHVGLADSCFELDTLRAFRDNVLSGMPGGEADIARYYRQAPELVRLIRQHRDGKSELSRAYLLYVLPSALFARFGLNRMAYRTYRSMMDELPRRLSA